MPPMRLRFTLRNLLVLLAIIALGSFGLRSWRRQVYCLGWASVWALNARQMQTEAAMAAAEDRPDRASFCEAQAVTYSELQRKYERTAYRFWEPLPTESPLPRELR
jgi:hypothetical protein